MYGRRVGLDRIDATPDIHHDDDMVFDEFIVVITLLMR